METHNQQHENYKKAYDKVQKIKGFYSHLISYVLVISLLVFINLKYSPKHLWFFYPMLGWGVGLIFHGFGAFNYVPFFGNDWEQKKLQQFLEEEKNNLKNQ